MLENIPALIDAFAQGPALLRSAVEEIAPANHDAVPVPGKWSVRQLVCHIADFELVSVDRIKRVIVEDNPTLEGQDQDTFAAMLHYSKRSVVDELALIEIARKHIMPILQNCDIEQFQRTGVHSEDGPMTLETLLVRTVRHIPHHVQFLKAKAAALSENA